MSKTSTTTKKTTTLVTVMWALVALGGCGGEASGDFMGSGGTSPVPKLPTQPTDEVAPTGTLDPQLVYAWPVSSVQVYWDGSGAPDGSASDPLRAGLASVPLQLAADGTFSFGALAGTWTVIPFVAADKALWGTGGRGPEGYAREIVLVVNGRVYTRGPIDDASPPGTSPWGLRIAFRVTSPEAGNILVMFQRPTSNTGSGTKK